MDRLTRLWTSRLGDRAIVRAQNPVRIPPDSELQPDLTLLRPRPDFYAKSHPEAAEVFLLIEVTDTTVETDRRVFHRGQALAPEAFPDLILTVDDLFG